MKKKHIQTLLLITLLVISVVMIGIGIQSDILPPILTGIGFFVIVGMMYTRG